jgi:O-antigen ligase
MEAPRLLPTQQIQRIAKWPLLLGALLLPYLFYELLPSIGVGQFVNIFNLERSFVLLGFMVAGMGYIRYIAFIKERPLALVIFLTALSPVVEALNTLLLEGMNINVKYRVLSILCIVAPCIYQMFKYLPAFNRTLPYLKYFLGFLAVITLYFIFYNAGMTDPKRAVDSLMTDGSYSWGQITSHYMIFAGVIVSAFALISSGNPRKAFDTINRAFLAITAASSLYTILGYPIFLTSSMIDGFLRAKGLLAHPNPFAHHMGVILIYQLGIYFYYQFQLPGEQTGEQKRMPAVLLYASFALNIIAFLLALSKTAIATTVGCVALFFILNIGSARYRVPLLRTLLAMALLLPLGFGAYQAATGKSIVEVIEARMEENTSLNWRNEVWDGLKADMWETPIFGHGFTASNKRIFQLYYNTKKNSDPLIMVHNGYIGLFYDFGVLGYLLFVAMVAFMWTAFKLWLTEEAYRPLTATVIAMGLYYMVVSNFDEMVYMFDAPNLIWALGTLIITLVMFARRERLQGPKTLPLPTTKGVVTP